MFLREILVKIMRGQMSTHAIPCGVGVGAGEQMSSHANFYRGQMYGGHMSVHREF